MAPLKFLAVHEISGGTFSHDVGEFCATGYACAKDSDNK